MRKNILKTITAVMLITAMTAITVFADDVNSLTNKKKNAQSELDSLQNQLSYLLVQMDTLQGKMATTSDQIEETNIELIAAQETQKQQYEDMKLRIKYMYEDQSESMTEALLTSNNMSEVLNKAEYMQKVYDYDRVKLQEMATTAQSIQEIKSSLEIEQSELVAMQSDLTSKQELLYTTIAEQESKVSNFGTQLSAAVEAAAKIAASTTTKSNYISTGDASVGAGIARLAYNYLGTPYRSGGASPGGFDCSGFTAYLYSQYGIGLSRTTGGQTGSGTRVASLSDALPGDVICYAGHVGVYIGGGQIIHASVPGDVVKVASANVMTIISIRRYW